MHCDLSGLKAVQGNVTTSEFSTYNSLWDLRRSIPLLFSKTFLSHLVLILTGGLQEHSKQIFSRVFLQTFPSVLVHLFDSYKPLCGISTINLRATAYLTLGQINVWCDKVSLSWISLHEDTGTIILGCCLSQPTRLHLQGVIQVTRCKSYFLMP